MLFLNSSVSRANNNSERSTTNICLNIIGFFCAIGIICGLACLIYGKSISIEIYSRRLFWNFLKVWLLSIQHWLLSVELSLVYRYFV